MPRPKRSAGKATVVVEKDPESKAPHPVDRIFEKVETAPIVEPVVTKAPLSGLRTAKVVEVTSKSLRVQVRGQREAVPAKLGEGVDREVVARAHKNRDVVLVDLEPGEEPVVLGVVQTRVPTELVLTGDTVRIEGAREVLLRSNTAALRLREDGDVELVGSRISAMSRGLFRLVGRMLRLN